MRQHMTCQWLLLLPWTDHFAFRVGQAGPLHMYVRGSPGTPLMRVLSTGVFPCHSGRAIWVFYGLRTNRAVCRALGNETKATSNMSHRLSLYTPIPLLLS
ncbi:hypothetical protein EDC04DRAFT_2780270, partial [Pisolithus marmoratus]